MILAIILATIAITLSITDLYLTNKYLKKYKKWQPNKPFNQIEKNVILLYNLKKWGFKRGMIFGGIVVFVINLLVIFFTPMWVVIILICILSFTIWNHLKNMKLLRKLIKKYPTGYLPKKVFGEVEGNNEKLKGGDLNE